MRRRGVATAVLVATAMLATRATAFAAGALVDLLDVRTLELVEPAAAVAADRAIDLLLLDVVRDRIAAGALAWTTPVRIHAVAADAGPALTPERLAVGELAQLLLLTRSRTAAASLADAAGPGWTRTRARMERVARRIGLTQTTVPEVWPIAPPRAAGGRTTIGDLAIVAGDVVGDGEIRRRIALDGAPIADGAIIVRATDPLVASTPRAAGADGDVAIRVSARDGLELLAVATAPLDADRLLQRGFERYRRIEVVRAGDTITGDVDVRGGERRELTAVTAEGFAITVPREGRFDVSAWVQLPGAPAGTSQRVGELVFEHAGRIVGAVPLVAPSAVPPTRWLDTARR